MERHYEHDEYEDNDFQRFKHNFGVFWDRYGNRILLVFSVLAIGFAVWSWVRRGQIEAREEALSQLATASSPEALIRVGDDYIGARPGVALAAYLEAGDLSLFEYLDLEKTEEERAKALANAKTAYSKALEKSDKPVFRVNALLGAAAVAENERDFELATTYYNDVLTLADENMLALHKAKAQARLELLPELSQPVTLLPDPEPVASETPSATDFSLEGLDLPALDLPDLDLPDLELPGGDLAPATERTDATEAE